MTPGETRAEGTPVYVCYTTAKLDDAQRRHRLGDRQEYCGACVIPGVRGGWVWPSECSHEGRWTKKEFEAAVRNVNRRKREPK